jgi:tetratricopeptide (TPR) repeat protein
MSADSKRKLSLYGRRRKTSGRISKSDLRRSVFEQVVVLKEGYLEKQSNGFLKAWQSRYFVLAGHYLKYFERKEGSSDQQASAVRGVVDLNDVRETKSSGQQITLEMQAGQRILLKAPSTHVADLWQHEIQMVAESLESLERLSTNTDNEGGGDYKEECKDEEEKEKEVEEEEEEDGGVEEEEEEEEEKEEAEGAEEKGGCLQQQKIKNMKHRLAKYTSQPHIALYQLMTAPTIEVYFECFCLSLESRFPGFTIWADERKVSILTTKLETESFCEDNLSVQEAMSFIGQTDFERGEELLREWVVSMTSYFADSGSIDLYEAYRADVAFIFLRANLQDACMHLQHTWALHLRTANPELYAELAVDSHESDGSPSLWIYNELSTLAVLGAIDPAAEEEAGVLLVQQAKLQWAAAGGVGVETMEPEQVRAMIQQGQQQQLAMVLQGVQQTNQLVVELAQAYDAEVREAELHPELHYDITALTQQESELDANATASTAAGCPVASDGASGVELLSKIPEAWLIIEGQEKGEHQYALMGRYERMAEECVNGRSVWKRGQMWGVCAYLYYVSSSCEWWISSNKEDMQAGRAGGLMKVAGGKALTPVYIEVAAWQVKVSGEGQWGNAPKVKVRVVGQHDGNHFELGISVSGFKMALAVMKWDEYERDENNFLGTDGKCWNSGGKNGYDFGVLVRSYLHAIGKAHLSFVEAVIEGEVEDLLSLRKEVGAGNAFYSHVQAVSVAITLQSLEDAEEMYGVVLRENPEGTKKLQRRALEAFFQEREGEGEVNSSTIDYFFDQGAPAEIEVALQECYGAAPDLQSLRASKPTHEPIKYFIDYLCIRQCLNDFAVPQVLSSIKTMGVVLVELDTNWRSEGALLRRIFCVLESFAATLSKGRLLVCGPVLQDREQVGELLQAATDSVRNKEVIDSRNKATCRWKEEEIKIRRYIEDSVGYNKLDKIMLAAIVRGCQSLVRGGEDATAAMLKGLAGMLYEVEEFKEALLWAREALQLQEAKHGSDSVLIADHLIQVGEYEFKVGTAQMGIFMRAQRILERENGKGHVSTARCLVGLGKAEYRAAKAAQTMQATAQAAQTHFNVVQHKLQNDTSAQIAEHYSTSMELGKQALAIVEAAFGLDTIESAGALKVIGYVHFELKQNDAALEHLERRIKIFEAHGGCAHEIVQDLNIVATAHEQRGDYEQAFLSLQRAVTLSAVATGKLSLGTGLICQNIGRVYCNQEPGRYAEAVPWYEWALTALTHSVGADHAFSKEVEKGLSDSRRRVVGQWWSSSAPGTAPEFLGDEVVDAASQRIDATFKRVDAASQRA